MTQQETAEKLAEVPAPLKEGETPKVEESKKQPRVYSEEEWNKNTSKLQKQIANLERERGETRQELTQTKADIQSMKDELELSNLTDEEEKKLRRELGQARRELAQREKTIQDAEQELGRRAKEFFAEQLAAQYGVEKDSLMEFGTVAEMRAAALEAENTKLKAEREKPAAKEKETLPPPPRHESGESLIPKKRVQDMTDQEFGPFWEQFKRRNAAVP